MKKTAPEILEKPRGLPFPKVWKFAVPILSLACFVIVLNIIINTISSNDFHDFNVFYSSAQAAIRGETIYRLYGPYDLPYWYFPWLSWFFIPVAIIPFDTAKYLFTFANFLSLGYLIGTLRRYFYSHLALSTQLFIFTMSIFMCWLLFKVGQMDFILAAIVVALMVMIDKKQNLQAGLFFPVLLFKPHLLTIFIPFAIIRGGKKLIIASLVSLLVVCLIAFALIPDWPMEMIQMLEHSGQRTDNHWDFTTFTELIGLDENWSGTGNIPVTLAIMLICFILVWKNQHLPTIPLLSQALAASLLCAPRAYSYNFPFLIPTLLWLPSEKPPLIFFLWALIGVISLASGYSTGAFLIVILAFGLSVIKANKLRTAIIE